MLQQHTLLCSLKEVTKELKLLSFVVESALGSVAGLVSGGAIETLRVNLPGFCMGYDDKWPPPPFKQTLLLKHISQMELWQCPTVYSANPEFTSE